MVEEAPASRSVAGRTEAQDPLPLAAVSVQDAPRFSTGSAELDRVLGGGLLPGSLTLIGGDPGIGKSTLALQCSLHVASTRGRVLYATGEESAQQVRLRTDRLGIPAGDLFVASETDLDVIEQQAIGLGAALLVVDSIQTACVPELASAPGSVAQVREGAARLLRLAKAHGIAVFVIGHVTKEGVLAGPRVLEHIVDTVLYFEGDRHGAFRILRAVKNRFGSTNEIGLFEMRNSGLVDVPDASRFFLSERTAAASGSVVVPTVEGTRPLLVEIQALVTRSSFLPPRRAADGIDQKRVQLVLAVLEKRAGLPLGSCDVYVKVAGGLSVEEPAVDLGLAIAIASSLRDRPCDPATAVMGEVGLAGEVRPVSRLEQRLREAEKLGFRRAVVPRSNLGHVRVNSGVEVLGVAYLREALQALLG